ncbi:MAG: TauD/TfdA family dioxygenase [Actinomycetota bacterium]
MLHATRLTPAIGAELHGLTADALRDEAIADALYKELMEHQVVFIRDADLGPVEMTTLGGFLGELGARHHSYVTHPDSNDVVVLEWGGDRKPDAAEWHSDMTYRPQPPFASILKAIQVPAVGGDTLWAGMYAVHDALSDDLRSELAELHAFHDMGAFRTEAYLAGGTDALEDAMQRAGQAVHPVIATHPVTDRPYLNVSESFTRFIIGLSAPESARLLTMLFDLINRPDFHVRLKWEPNTIAIWDNRGTQHYAVADYLPHRRVMHRVAVRTDRRVDGIAG